MKIKLQALVLAVSTLCLTACDDDTAELGTSLIPEGDLITVVADSCFATSRTVMADDSLLVMSSQCNVGRYTEPIMGASFETGYLTQLNCLETFSLPDSVYGIGDHRFPDWFVSEMEGVDPYYANLRLYFTSYFGDAQNPIKLDIFELDRKIDPASYYYTSIDPSQFCDMEKGPVASINVSAENFQDSDSLRYLSTYYPSVTVRLPDTLAKKILTAYYSSEGREYFRNAESFMDNLCKGFYIRCAQGDGTILYVDQSVLQVNFKCLEVEDDSTYLASYLAEFNGNSEVLQVNSFKWKGLESRCQEEEFSWVLSPFGLLTEITLPVDEMKKDGSVLNSAEICISSAVTPSSGEYGASIPPYLMLIRKSATREFFSKNSTVDNTESFVASYSSKYGTYTYSNIAALVEQAYSDRSEWLQANGHEADAQGFNAYVKAYPDWDKVVLIPVTPQTDSNSSVLGYTIDIGMHQVKLIGGPKGNHIKIKTIRSHF